MFLQRKKSKKDEKCIKKFFTNSDFCAIIKKSGVLEMNKRKRQEKSKRKLNIRVCLMVALFAYLSYALSGQLVSLRQTAVRASQLEAEIAEAEGRLAEVQDLDRISKSDAYIEKVAREKLGLVKPDETVFVDVSGR